MNNITRVFVLIVGSMFLLNSQVPIIREIDSYPKLQHNLFFKTTPFIAVDAVGSIYTIDNGSHLVSKINVIKDEVTKIASKGQGPGEVQNPYFGIVKGETLFVIDNSSVNLFNLEGKYKGRFRVFESVISVGADQETIYLAQTGGDKLIQEYSYQGKRKGSFGNKYQYNNNIYKDWPETYIDSKINEGKVIIGDKFIFYISYEFSELLIYRADRSLMERIVIEDDELAKNNRDYYLYKGQIKPSDNSFIVKKIVIDAYYFNGYLYIIRYYMNKEKKDVEVIKIPESNVHNIEKIYFDSKLQIEPKYIRNLCIGGINRIHPYYYLSLYDEKKGDYEIKILREEK